MFDLFLAKEYAERGYEASIKKPGIDPRLNELMRIATDSGDWLNLHEIIRE